MLLAALLVGTTARAAPVDLVALYQDLHRHPELAFQETRSAALLASEARAAGFAVTEKVGRTGVVAVLANGPGPVILIRTDMDALPVKEATGLAYASTATGRAADGSQTPVMHACGHDIHMAAWVGTARALAAARTRWSGTVVMIAQPAEEDVAGAGAMLEDGLYTRFPKPAHALAFHDAAALPAGTVAVPDGFLLANVDSVDIDVRGIGSHGSEPHLGIDPVVVGAAIVTRLQALISRTKDPRAPAVITAGSFHSGTRRNIISDAARIELTVRSYDEPTRALLLAGIPRIARAEAEAAGTPPELLPRVTVNRGSDATFNTPDQTPKVRAAIAAALGAANVVTVPASMAAEDFGQFSKGLGIESTMFWVGATPKAVFDAAAGDQRKIPGLHSARFAPDAPVAIATAVKAMTAATLALLTRR